MQVTLPIILLEHIKLTGGILNGERNTIQPSRRLLTISNKEILFQTYQFESDQAKW